MNYGEDFQKGDTEKSPSRVMVQEYGGRAINVDRHILQRHYMGLINWQGSFELPVSVRSYSELES